ncbi:hypothetical protein ACFVIM_16965 [Streptomyces sp. NPDC057638]|uniref:hypothetical protein n=1 Tax=Streptomyces sp. NPDC057638 TaxID=3346190 RepID=UPI0036CADD19
MIRTFVGGELVTLPGTIAEIRAGLTEEERARFEEEISGAPLAELPRVAARWALPPAARRADDEVFERLSRGDYTGIVDERGGPVPS